MSALASSQKGRTVTIVTTDPPRVQLLQESLRLFWPDPPDDLWIVVSWANPAKGFCSQWVRVRALDQALRILEEKSQQYDTYVGMGLRHGACRPVAVGRAAMCAPSAASGWNVIMPAACMPPGRSRPRFNS